MDKFTFEIVPATEPGNILFKTTNCPAIPQEGETLRVYNKDGVSETRRVQFIHWVFSPASPRSEHNIALVVVYVSEPLKS